MEGSIMNILLHFYFLKILFSLNQKLMTLIALLLSLFFFNDLCFANELSPEEKRDFIESLATPSTEERVFYRWQPKEVAQKLLSAGEMTQELYEHYVGTEMYSKPAIAGRTGKGLYVAENRNSSSHYGDSIIKVVVSAGYPFIDLNDERIKARLQEKGISLEEAYKLKLRVAIKDSATLGRIVSDTWWCLKKPEGIQFKPVANQELIANFKYATLEYKRGGKAAFFNLLTRQQQVELIYSIENFIDAVDLLFVGQKQFSKRELSIIVSYALPHIESIQDAKIFLQIGWEYFSEADKIRIMDKTLSFIQNKRELSELETEMRKVSFRPEIQEDALRNFQDRVSVIPHLANQESMEDSRESRRQPTLQDYENFLKDLTIEDSRESRRPQNDSERTNQTKPLSPEQKVVASILGHYAIETALKSTRAYISDPETLEKVEKHIRCVFAFK